MIGTNGFGSYWLFKLTFTDFLIIYGKTGKVYTTSHDLLKNGCILSYILGGKIAALVKEVDYFGLESSDKKREKRLVIVNYVSRTFYFHNLYATKFVVCEILNLLNIIGQMYFTNYFLKGQFLTYGADVWNYDYSAKNATIDPDEPMVKAFPKVIYL